MIDSGENASAYCVYDFFSYDTSDTSKLGMTISNVRIQGKGNRRQVAAGIIYSNSCNIDVDNYILESDIDYGVCYSMGGGSMKVRNSEIRSKTKIAWSKVDELYDSIHTGTTQNWGAKKSVRCIDAGSEWGTYDLGDISSSIVLYPDANGVYTYYSSSGTKATFTGIDLIDKNLFASMLGFDEQIWNLDNIDVKNGIYPTIRGAEK